MAEVVLAGEASNDSSLIAEPQGCTYAERNDSCIGPLPTEGYRIFDARPESEVLANFVSRPVLFAVLGSKLTTMLHRHATLRKIYTHPFLHRRLTITLPRAASNFL